MAKCPLINSNILESQMAPNAITLYTAKREIRRDGIHKTVKFTGVDAHLCYGNFETFLNCYLNNNNFIAHRSVPIRKKGG